MDYTDFRHSWHVCVSPFPTLGAWKWINIQHWIIRWPAINWVSKRWAWRLERCVSFNLSARDTQFEYNLPGGSWNQRRGMLLFKMINHWRLTWEMQECSQSDLVFRKVQAACSTSAIWWLESTKSSSYTTILTSKLINGISYVQHRGPVQQRRYFLLNCSLMMFIWHSQFTITYADRQSPSFTISHTDPNGKLYVYGDRDCIETSEDRQTKWVLLPLEHDDGGIAYQYVTNHNIHAQTFWEMSILTSICHSTTADPRKAISSRLITNRRKVYVSFRILPVEIACLANYNDLVRVGSSGWTRGHTVVQVPCSLSDVFAVFSWLELRVHMLIGWVFHPETCSFELSSEFFVPLCLYLYIFMGGILWKG